MFNRARQVPGIQCAGLIRPKLVDLPRLHTLFLSSNRFNIPPAVPGHCPTQNTPGFKANEIPTRLTDLTRPRPVTTVLERVDASHGSVLTAWHGSPTYSAGPPQNHWLGRPGAPSPTTAANRQGRASASWPRTAPPGNRLLCTLT